ncbi:zinc finger, CCHC-type containing protein [Tanacetum coccineum]
MLLRMLKLPGKAEYRYHSACGITHAVADLRFEMEYPTSCKQPQREIENPSLNKDFVRNFNMHCVGKTVSELHALLIDYEKGLKDKAPTPQQNPSQKKENPKKDQACHYCNVVGHWKRNCPLYLEELRTNKNKKAEHGAAPSVGKLEFE